jgi:hypothetical protein
MMQRFAIVSTVIRVERLVLTMTSRQKKPHTNRQDIKQRRDA